jgi:hypothetical protein
MLNVRVAGNDLADESLNIVCSVASFLKKSSHVGQALKFLSEDWFCAAIENLQQSAHVGRKSLPD